MTDRRNDPTLVTQSPSEGSGASGRLLGEGARIGRYTIVGLLGRGGMGAVYEAEDPELARRVAIKILHEDRNDEDERTALRREAQALATLVHQNVVMVYDVGIDDDGDVFLVMQLVEGETIDAWIARTKPSPEAIIAKFQHAGAGLAAAHVAGLVHCDFKPANVLVDDLGGVRVGDFGLARRAAQRITARGDDAEPTLMTTLAGTPAYMAPEQFEGKVTPASDQFAFCVALWECLAGERPFADSSVATLDPASRGPRRELPRNRRIPRHARRVLERGMAESPAARFSSMTELLAALHPSRTTTYVAIAVGAALIGGAAVYLATRSDPATTSGWGGADVAARQNLTGLGETACAYAPMVDSSGDVIFDRTRGDAVDLYAVPLAGGPLRQLTSSPNWEWRAQRGRRAGEVSYLFHARVEGETSRVDYLDLASGKSTPALRADVLDAITVGDRLYYSPIDHKGIWVLQGEEEKPFAVPPPGLTYANLTASFAGDQLAVARYETNGNGTACTLEVAHPEQLRCESDLVTPTRPAFGRDGDVLYIAALDGIYRRDLVTRQTTRLTDDYAEGGLSIAPDGSALVFSSCRVHTAILDPETMKPIVDDPDGNHPAVAADGTLAWVRAIGNKAVLMLRTPSGRITQLTTLDQGSVAYPRFSPDSATIVFAMTEPTPGIHVIGLGKPGSLRQVTRDDKDYFPFFVGNDLIAFSQEDEAGGDHVFTVGINGTGRHEYTSSTRTLYGGRGKELLLNSVKGMLWLDPATGAERPGPPAPTQEPDSGATSPSGNWVVYSMGIENRTIYRTRTDGSSKLELVKQFESNINATKPSISDTGQVLVQAGPMYGDVIKIPAKPGSHF